jgi:hypothetical protein
MGKYNTLNYKALNNSSVEEEFDMKVCEECTDVFQKAGTSEEEFGINIGRDDPEI